MNANDVNQRLSRIMTQWSMVFQAHQGAAEAADAQQMLLQRYGGAIYRYLLGALRDPDAADELAQEFALRFVRGDFRRADPEKGRFRDFVKTAIFHLIVDHQKRKKGRPRPLSDGFEPAAPKEGTLEADREFIASWRDELLARAWDGLEQVQQETGQPYHAVLRFRAENPDLKSDQMATQLGERLGKPLTSAGVRQTLHRAREKFADLLLDEVARSVETTRTDAIEQELIDLNLLTYCQSALERRAR